MGTLLADQKLLRDSLGSIASDGMVTNNYQENRGNTKLLIAKASN